MQWMAPSPQMKSPQWMPTISRSGKVSENIERDAIVGIVEGRHQHQSIGDVKIGVAGGQPLSAKDNGAGKRQFDDLQLASLKISGGAQAAQVFLQRFVVGVAHVGLDNGEDGIGGDEAGDVIHVAVGVVALMPQPSQITFSTPR